MRARNARLRFKEVIEIVVTMKQIAEIVGVSRGTVDRALNNRGQIAPETKKRVLDVAKALDYKPNQVGKALVAQKRPYKIGVIFPFGSSQFWLEVKQGFIAAQKEFAGFGIKIIYKHTLNFDPNDQLKLIDELLNEGIDALAIVPLDHQIIKDQLNDLHKKNMPVIIFNSLIEDTKFLAFVGCDYIKSGATSAGMVNLIYGEKDATLLLFTGSKSMFSHHQRVTGFMQEINDNINIVDSHGIFEDDFTAYDATLMYLNKHKDLNAIHIVAGNSLGICKAIEKMGLKNQIKVFTYDLTPEMKPLMKDGLIYVTVCQEPFNQGYLPIKILFEYLFNNVSPEKDMFYMRNEIIIAQNM